MSDEEVYYCYVCKTIKREWKEEPVFCCGKEMTKQPLNQCVKSPSDAEHARTSDDDQPCDDGH